ncbi:outer envelope pore protein 16-3, chloroplastic/mitochondrial-like [Rutidosis leptorrhynchoides]|uniref:outer envelope pore protein 16-3, chloroplastic/mitochondrial-like n=1 Tax=Rutidosis leptorrhynchoides TaxID=125765 RepID=UPI003A9997A4
MDSTNPIDAAELRYLEDDDTPMMKTIKGATMGLAAGTIWGTVVATWNDVPRVERSVALPGLLRTLKMMGNHGLTFAAIGGVYIGVEQLVEHYRTKRDFVNGAVGAFAAGSTILGYKGKSISSALSAGAALAVTSALIDAGGQTTRVDNGKEYYPYTTKKRTPAEQ